MTFINTIGAAMSLLGMICLAININKSHSQNDSAEMSQPTAKDVYEWKLL